MKHTPGPWTIETGRITNRLYVEISNVQLDLAIAEISLLDREDMSVDDSGPGLKTLANAQLIAAAPILLEALVELEMNARMASAFINHALLEEAVVQAQRAIAKAQGKS